MFCFKYRLAIDSWRVTIPTYSSSHVALLYFYLSLKSICTFWNAAHVYLLKYNNATCKNLHVLLNLKVIVTKHCTQKILLYNNK